MLIVIVFSASLATAFTGSDPRPAHQLETGADATACAVQTRRLRTFDRLDRDADGILTPSDTRRRHMGRDRGRTGLQDPLRASLDIDGDGRATRAELTGPSDCPESGRTDPQS